MVQIPAVDANRLRPVWEEMSTRVDIVEAGIASDPVFCGHILPKRGPLVLVIRFLGVVGVCTYDESAELGVGGANGLERTGGGWVIIPEGLFEEGRGQG